MTAKIHFRYNVFYRFFFKIQYRGEWIGRRLGQSPLEELDIPVRSVRIGFRLQRAGFRVIIPQESEEIAW